MLYSEVLFKEQLLTKGVVVPKGFHIYYSKPCVSIVSDIRIWSCVFKKCTAVNQGTQLSTGDTSLMLFLRLLSRFCAHPLFYNSRGCRRNF
jgi:hypothetical protein